jgi:hypothetical protein
LILAALLYAALTAPDSGTIVPVSGKPFVVEWEVRWKPPLSTSTHRRRFATADEAVAFELAAPLCAKQPAPCVMWIHASVYTFDPKVKICALR